MRFGYQLIAMGVIFALACIFPPTSGFIIQSRVMAEPSLGIMKLRCAAGDPSSCIRAMHKKIRGNPIWEKYFENKGNVDNTTWNIVHRDFYEFKDLMLNKSKMPYDMFRSTMIDIYKEYQAEHPATVAPPPAQPCQASWLSNPLKKVGEIWYGCETPVETSTMAPAPEESSTSATEKALDTSVDSVTTLPSVTTTMVPEAPMDPATCMIQGSGNTTTVRRVATPTHIPLVDLLQLFPMDRSKLAILEQARLTYVENLNSDVIDWLSPDYPAKLNQIYLFQEALSCLDKVRSERDFKAAEAYILAKMSARGF